MSELRGSLSASGCRFALVVSRFNEEITEGLLKGARQALADASVPEGDITVLRVPGAFEIPVAALRAAETGQFDAVICIGCVIKGETMHFEYIASAVSQGIMAVSADTGIPVTFGVLTTLTEQQATARSADDSDNKGREAALAAVEMAAILREIGDEARHDG
jgi:6,7-dimethyl-8-ribityllumazine synthase